jgi:hypothetical protein
VMAWLIARRPGDGPPRTAAAWPRPGVVGRSRGGPAQRRELGSDD